jgi:hypothetical protein
MLWSLIDKIPSKVRKTYKRAQDFCIVGMKRSIIILDVHQDSYIGRFVLSEPPGMN